MKSLANGLSILEVALASDQGRKIADFDKEMQEEKRKLGLFLHNLRAKLGKQYVAVELVPGAVAVESSAETTVEESIPVLVKRLPTVYEACTGETVFLIFPASVFIFVPGSVGVVEVLPLRYGR